MKATATIATSMAINASRTVALLVHDKVADVALQPLLAETPANTESLLNMHHHTKIIGILVVS